MKVWILFIAICLLVCSVSAQPLSSEKMAMVKASIVSGSGGLAYEMQNPNVMYLTYRIQNYDPATYDYRIRLFTNGHEMIVNEIPLTNAAGIVKYKVNALDSMQGTYWLNLMQTVKGDDEAQMAYCEKTGYPCEISKNLDIVRMDVGSNKAYEKFGNDYEQFLSGAYRRSGSEPKGAAWKNRG